MFVRLRCLFCFREGKDHEKLRIWFLKRWETEMTCGFMSCFNRVFGDFGRLPIDFQFRKVSQQVFHRPPSHHLN